jgi:hypothetical protein
MSPKQVERHEGGEEEDARAVDGPENVKLERLMDGAGSSTHLNTFVWS